MSYEIHKEGMCDKCEEKPECWIVPFLYKDMNDKSHTDIGDGYRQYFICDDCKEIQDRILRKQGLVPMWIKI
jgi:hypothetical protein